MQRVHRDCLFTKALATGAALGAVQGLVTCHKLSSLLQYTQETLLQQTNSMAAATLPMANGNGIHHHGIVEIPLKDQPDQILEIDVATLPEPSELISILESEEAAAAYWVKVAVGVMHAPA